MSGHVYVDGGLITIANPVISGTTAVITTPLTIGSVLSGTISSSVSNRPFVNFGGTASVVVSSITKQEKKFLNSAIDQFSGTVANTNKSITLTNVTRIHDLHVYNDASATASLYIGLGGTAGENFYIKKDGDIKIENIDVTSLYFKASTGTAISYRALVLGE